MRKYLFNSPAILKLFGLLLLLVTLGVLVFTRLPMKRHYQSNDLGVEFTYPASWEISEFHNDDYSYTGACKRAKSGQPQCTDGVGFELYPSQEVMLRELGAPIGEEFESVASYEEYAKAQSWFLNDVGVRSIGNRSASVWEIDTGNSSQGQFRVKVDNRHYIILVHKFSSRNPLTAGQELIMGTIRFK